MFDTAPCESVTVTAYVESPSPGVSVMLCVVANGAPFFVHAYVKEPVPPSGTAVRLTESPSSTSPPGAPEIDADGTSKSREPAERGGIEDSGGSVSGTGTNPSATRAATSGPATPPTSFPISVSSPADWKTGPNPPENRLTGDGSGIEQSTMRQTPAVTMSAITPTVFWKSSVHLRLICAFPDVLTQWSRGESLSPSGWGCSAWSA